MGFLLQDFLGATPNAHRLVADSLQVAIYLDHSKNETEIDSHWLFLSEQFICLLIDFALRGIDCTLCTLNKLAKAFVSKQVSFKRRTH